eukprot:CAMPEP_0119503012 /NCGR_PEP_ID=MMETSP1344-20130328/24312_1 /TAXON_ID=236787 /ORGANISM="Florenciella parvula, Strain CCMP2471" /LENGTH=38 /DNA_ID= /DNA_START= /DNA_END= /DNA_ORIENTATION=
MAMALRLFSRFQIQRRDVKSPLIDRGLEQRGELGGSEF